MIAQGYKAQGLKEKNNLRLQGSGLKGKKNLGLQGSRPKRKC